MKNLSILFAVILLAGCATQSPPNKNMTKVQEQSMNDAIANFGPICGITKANIDSLPPPQKERGIACVSRYQREARGQALRSLSGPIPPVAR